MTTTSNARLIYALLVPAFVLGAAGLAAAQAPADAADARIAVINTGQIFSESLLGKGYAAKIEALEQEIQAAQQEKETTAQQKNSEITTLKEELQKQASVLSPEGREKKAQEIRQKERELQAYVEDGRIEIQRLQQRAQQQAQNLNNEYQLKIRPHIEAVAKEKGLDILLDSSVALAITQSYDISKEIISKADAAERAAGAESPSQ
jgi:Skp family chaperone for outer membrane proteins